MLKRNVLNFLNIKKEKSMNEKIKERWQLFHDVIEYVSFNVVKKFGQSCYTYEKIRPIRDCL